MDIYTQEIPSMLLTVCVVSWLLELSHNYRWVSIVDLIIEIPTKKHCVSFANMCMCFPPKCEKNDPSPVLSTMKVDILRYFINVAVTLKH